MKLLKSDISIREKLVVYYASLSIAAILFLGFYIYNNSYNAVLERTSNQLTSIREFKKHQIELFFKDRINEIKYLQKTLVYDGSLFSNEFNNKLFSFLNNSEYYSFACLSYPGDSTVKTIKVEDGSLKLKNETDHTGFFEGIKKKTLSRHDVYIEDYRIILNENVLLFSIGIYDIKTNRNLILSLALNEKTINKLVFVNTSLSGMGYSGESYIVGNDYLMRSLSRFDSLSVMRKVVQTQPVIESFQGSSDVIQAKDYRNIEVLSSFSRLGIPDLQWSLFVEIDFKELMSPIYEIKNHIIVLLSIITIIVLILAFFISYRITVPLVKLSKMANDISKGKFGETLKVKSRDEIGELTHRFNLMSKRIQEQTKEIIERERRLDRFYEATKDGIIIHEGIMPLMVNKGLATLTRYSIEELMEISLNKILFLQDYEDDYENVDKSLTFESICFRKDGSFFHAEIKKSPIVYEGVRVNSTIIHDISDRIAAQVALNNERQKQLSSFIDGQEDERKRVSRELHDGLGQSLIAIKMRLESIDNYKDTKHLQSTIELTKAFVGNTIEDVRRMSNNLMPSSLVEFGIVTAIQNLVDQLSLHSKMAIHFEHKSMPKDLDARIQLYLYRIIQEAIHNSVKHAEATILQILLICENKSVILIIEDNGKGFPQGHESSKKGNGLYHMCERVKVLNGTIEFNSKKNNGLTIQIKIPV